MMSAIVPLLTVNNNVFLASIEKIIGHINDPDIDILEIAYNHGITLDFSKETIEELKTIPEVVSEAEKKDRVDLTNQVIFTVKVPSDGLTFFI